MYLYLIKYKILFLFLIIRQLFFELVKDSKKSNLLMYRILDRSQIIYLTVNQILISKYTVLPEISFLLSIDQENIKIYMKGEQVLCQMEKRYMKIIRRNEKQVVMKDMDELTSSGRQAVFFLFSLLRLSFFYMWAWYM